MVMAVYQEKRGNSLRKASADKASRQVSAPGVHLPLNAFI